MDASGNNPLYPEEKSSFSSFMSANGKYFGVVIAVLLFFNLLYLNYKSFLPQTTVRSMSQLPQGSIALLPTQSPSYCPQACITEILSATSSAVSTQTIAATIPTQTPSPTQTPTPTQVPASPNEYFVPIGTGSGSYTTMTSIPGFAVSLNPANYPGITTVTFEATIWIPTGNQTVWVQLYNANTFQMVPNSLLTISGGTATLATSTIFLAPGNNQYQVQLNTQLGYTTYIQQARLRIQTN